MTNEITRLYSELSDEQLKEAIREMKEDESLGIIRSDEWVKKLTKQVCEITGESTYSTHLFLTHTSLLREAAYRFTK